MSTIKEKIIRYCQYQERCHKEVKNKLYELGAHSEEVEQLLCTLLELGLIDEQRFAESYTRGKFRIKQWGKNKIVTGLKQLQISPYCIQKGLAQIEEQEYLETLEKLAYKKLNLLKKEKNPFLLKKQLFQYLYQKGYESELIQEEINKIFLKA